VCLRKLTRLSLVLPWLIVAGCAPEAKVQPTTIVSKGGAATLSSAAREQLKTIRDGAVTFLKHTAQAEDGSFSQLADPGVTALATTALLRSGLPPDDRQVAKSLQYLESFAKDDGGIYRDGTFYRNYETCIAIMCFAAANVDGRYDELLAAAESFVTSLQWGTDEGQSIDDPAFGGGGYGKHQRPDLSNTQFLIDALRAVGNDENDAAIQRALIFVSRCQNLESEHNTTEFAAKNPDGGFYYSAAAGGSSQAGETDTGGLRSYGSMTYAGLKSLIYAGVKADDPRVQAAIGWISENYDLSQNPGLGDAGLYYYYHTFAKALDALGTDSLPAADGQLHNWRSELIAELADKQRDDGAFVNANERWLEGDPNLVTAYALLALSYCE
jgi:squalene-hopene/tetraprenyl-beta-curcumene cyclase